MEDTQQVYSNHILQNSQGQDKKSQIMLYIRLWNGKGLKLTKPVGQNIAQIKAVVGSHFQIPENQMKVIFQGQVLQNQGVTLQEAGVIENSILHIMHKQNQEKIMVELIFAQHKLRRKISIKSSESILSLKQQIQKFTRLPIENQTLIYCGGELNNNQLVSNYSINSGSIISLVDKNGKGLSVEDYKAWFQNYNFKDGSDFSGGQIIEQIEYQQKSGDEQQLLKILLMRNNGISSVEQISRSANILALINKIRAEPNLLYYEQASIILRHNGVKLHPQQKIKDLNWKAYEILDLSIQ